MLLFCINQFRHGHGVEDIGNALGIRYICPMGHWHNGTGHCKYRGQYDRGTFHGEGEFVCQDGRYYKGMWNRNKKHGKGLCYYLRDGEAGDATRLFIGGIGSLYRVKFYDGEWQENQKEVYTIFFREKIGSSFAFLVIVVFLDFI